MFDDMMEMLTFATQVEEPEEKHLGVLVMGGPGSGKTHFASTANKSIVFDYDHGLATYITNGLQKGKDFYPVVFEKFDFKDQNTPKGNKKILKARENISVMFQYLAMMADKSGPFAEGGIMGDVETIVIDSMTAVSDYYLYEIMISRLGLNYDTDKPGFDGYGQLKRSFAQLCELIVKCLKHYDVVMTVHPKWGNRPGATTDDDKIAEPDLDGSFKSILGKYLDEFYYIEAKPMGGKIDHIAWTSPRPTIPGLKSRAKLPAKVSDATFPMVKKTFVETFEKNRKKEA